MKNVRIRDLIIGEGIPKICVPLVGTTPEDYEKEILAMSDQRFDLIEWRIDCFKDHTSIDAVLEIATWIREHTKPYPLLATLRTVRDGGNGNVSHSYYQDMYRALIDHDLVDMIDIEYRLGKENVNGLLTYAQLSKIPVITSMHYFTETPEVAIMVEDMKKMQELGGDLVKLAVMPSNRNDVIHLLEATQIMYDTYALVPLITMAMGELGMITRISGESFGSSMTFASLMQKSAPGQLPVEEVKTILAILHHQF